jgi:hypothetical protein
MKYLVGLVSALEADIEIAGLNFGQNKTPARIQQSIAIRFAEAFQSFINGGRNSLPAHSLAHRKFRFPARRNCHEERRVIFRATVGIAVERETVFSVSEYDEEFLGPS